jgi:outer membrane protein TolC
MMSLHRTLLSVRFITAVATGIVAQLGARPAFALQPLSAFVTAARSGNTDERIAALTAEQQEADALTALGRTTPAVSARVVYTRNQFEAKIDPTQFTGGVMVPGAEPLVVQPFNQLDAYFQLDVPIIDLAGWARTRSARASAHSAQKSARATALDVQKQVARQYYQVIGGAALGLAAQRTLAAAEQNLTITRDRQESGVATALDIDRASSEVERARQSISDAELTVELSRRALRTLTGLAPEGGTPEAADDLHEETPLASWEASTLQTNPQLAASAAQRRSAESASSAAKLALVPSISASAQEHLTNAPGFYGHNSIWVLSGTANWRLDLVTVGTVESQSAAADIARVRESATRQRVLDQVHESWFRVHNGIAKSRAARAEAQASQSAVARARERYQAGAATQLELVQAERDAFSADVARIQADADLSYARAALRLDSGRPLEENNR